MASLADTLMRAGQISGSQWERLKLQKGPAQKTQMANFDDKAGVRDQGGIRDRGHSDAGRSHIDKNQKMAGGGISGKPSKGGAVGAYGQPGRAEIDDGKNQKPDFPAGAKAKASNAKKRLSNQPGVVRGKMGGQYGGGGQGTQ